MATLRTAKRRYRTAKLADRLTFRTGPEVAPRSPGRGLMALSLALLGGVRPCAGSARLVYLGPVAAQARRECVRVVPERRREGEPARMKESRRTFLSVLGIYLAGSWVVLQVVDVLKQNLGLPPWAFSLALTLLIIGLPVVAATAWLQGRAQRELATGAARTPADAARAPQRGSAVHGLFTWRNALMAGLGAMALWGVVATGWLLKERRATEGGSAAAVTQQQSRALFRAFSGTLGILQEALAEAPPGG
jgi:hypothetical protein